MKHMQHWTQSIERGHTGKNHNAEDQNNEDHGSRTNRGCAHVPVKGEHFMVLISQSK